MKQGRKTAQEECIQIGRECIACGKNYGKMTLKYNVSYQQVRTWTLRYEYLGEAGLLKKAGVAVLHISITTEDNYALAFVVAE